MSEVCVDIFHLSLPLARAALVPSWAMALQSVRAASFTQDFFPPLCSNVVFFLSFFLSDGAAPVKRGSFARIQSPGSQDFLRARLGCEDAR